MSRAAILKVDDYQQETIEEAFVKGIQLLGLPENFFKNKKVLLKPNFLAPSPVERAVCSHPSIIGAAASISAGMGGIVSAGDSPGLGSVFKAARSCGAAEVLESLGVPLVSFENPVEVKFPQGVICRSFPLARPVLETDMVISLARLKTHNFTGYTGAVKNLYGCISGRHKAALHLRYHRVEHFSRMLADLFGLIPPALSVVDGIVSMEGPGPRGGNPRFTGFLIMSEDGVAADAVACSLVGMNPEKVLHLKYAGEMGYGVHKINQLDLVGDSFQQLQVRGFKQAPGSSFSIRGFNHPLVSRFLRNLLISIPDIIPEKCTGCRVCAEHCPAEVINMDKKAYINQNGCIRCYCCQELCPHDAVRLKKSFRFSKP